MSLAMKISAQDVKKLREMTGAGMMDCKKALEEAEGDFEKAIDFLRKKGQKLSAKRADREAKEGVVIAKVNQDQSKGVIVRLSCETDFVAKNQSFIDLTVAMAELALDQFPNNHEEFLGLNFNGLTIREKVIEETGRIGEKIELASYERLEAPMVVSYIHMGNKAGVIIGLNHADGEYLEAGKNVAMQVAAMNPIAIDKDDVKQDTIRREIEIGMEQAKQEGKPEALLERIATGKLNKFFKENTLLNQAYVKDGKMSVRDYLKSKNNELTVTDFKHVRLG